MNLNKTSFFNSTEVNISSRMNEYMKKNFGYEVEGDIATLQEAKKSLQAEQLELKDNNMSSKYIENMLMIETITSLLKAHGETLEEDDGRLKKDPATGKYDPEEIRKMQYQQNVADPLNKGIDSSKTATTISVEYDLELDKPKSQNPLLKRHYQLMRKFNVFISMPEWQGGDYGQWFADVRGSKENLLGWLKAWDYDQDYIDDVMGLEESAKESLEEEPGDQDGMYDSGKDYEVDQHIDNQKSATKISMAKLKAGDEVQILAKGPGAERNGLKKGENPYGEGNTVQILGFGVVPFEAKTSNKSHVIADSLVDFKDLYKKEIRNLKSDEDYERDLQMRDNPRARLNIIVNDIVPNSGFVGFIYQSSSGPGLMYISRSLSGDKWAVNFSDDMEFDLVSGDASQSESLEEDEEKGPDHYRWKNDSQLSQAERLLAVCIEKLDDAITYRAENSHLFFNNGDKAGTGDLYGMKDKLEKLHDNWDEHTEYYGM